jgi:uncharacterized membrane protein
MHKGRLEAFSDAVIAVIITIMVLELHAPHEATFAALAPLAPTLLFYVLSFVYLGIYWNNHHHMLQAAQKGVTGPMLWANMHLLFWLSLVPLATSWMGEHHTAPVPIAAYGFVLFMAGVAYTILAQLLLRHEGPGSTLATAVGRDLKGWTSIVAYLVAISVAWIAPYVSKAIYVLVAAMWFIPYRRIERMIDRGRAA